MSNYDHVESKVKIYIENIKRQNHKSPVKPPNTMDYETANQELIENLRTEINNLGAQIKVLCEENTKLREDNAEKDLKIDYFRLELTNIKSNLPTCIAPGELSVYDFSEVLEVQEPTANSTYDLDSLQPIIPPVAPKLRQLRKAKKVLLKIFKCNCSKVNTSVTCKPNFIAMNTLESERIAKSLHTPRVGSVRKINFNKFANSPNINVMSTPAPTNTNLLRSNLRKSVLFRDDVATTRVVEHKENIEEEIDLIIEKLQNIKRKI